MWPNPQFLEDLVTFIENILNWTFYFLCSGIHSGLHDNLTSQEKPNVVSQHGLRKAWQQTHICVFFTLWRELRLLKFMPWNFFQNYWSNLICCWLKLKKLAQNVVKICLKSTKEARNYNTKFVFNYIILLQPLTSLIQRTSFFYQKRINGCGHQTW